MGTTVDLHWCWRRYEVCGVTVRVAVLHVVVHCVVCLRERVEGMSRLRLSVVWHGVMVEGGEDGFVAFPALEDWVVCHAFLI